MNTTLRYISLLVSMLSVISLVQHFFNFGLSGVFNDIISYYRHITYQLFNLIGQLISISFPPKLMDLWTISFIGAGAYVKTPNIEFNRLLRNRDVRSFPKHWKIILFFLMGFSFTGFFLLLSAFSPSTYIDSMNEEPQDLIKGMLKNTLIILIGIIVFFALNAYAPSV